MTSNFLSCGNTSCSWSIYLSNLPLLSSMEIKPSLPPMTPSSFSTEVEKWCHFFHSYLVMLNCPALSHFPIQRVVSWVFKHFSFEMSLLLSPYFISKVSPLSHLYTSMKLYVELSLFLFVVLLNKGKTALHSPISILQCFSVSNLVLQFLNFSRSHPTHCPKATGF